MKMIRLATVVACFVLLGCATTPEPVTRINTMNIEAIGILEYNTNQIIAGYTEKLKKAYESHMLEWYETQMARITTPTGMVKVTDINQLMMLYAQQQGANDIWLEGEATTIRNRMEAQFAVVRQLEELQLAYNNAYGVPPEKIQTLIDMSVGLAQDVAATEDSSVTDIDGSPDWDAIISLLGSRFGISPEVIEVVRDVVENGGD